MASSAEKDLKALLDSIEGWAEELDTNAGETWSDIVFDMRDTLETYRPGVEGVG